MQLNDENNKNNLNIYQFIMGGGKSTTIIPYYTYCNFLRNKTVLIMIPENDKIKSEMFYNINKIFGFFKSILAMLDIVSIKTYTEAK